MNSNSKFVFGIDEVGRGCVAGPLVVCACLDSKSLLDYEILNDSKKITPKKREILARQLIQNETFFIAVCPSKTIDSIKMAASLKLTFWNLSCNVRMKFQDAFLLIDGNLDFGIQNCETVIKGDTKHKSIMAASVIAKVYRDKMMINEANRFLNFDFKSHKGYLTKKHIQEIKESEITYLHRESFLSNYL
ncbi:ribonuclease HII [bacterium]|jgi:ribonuclease HII|nr:ribonuclease HII [bacterium]MBT6293819.1 ribonuclease HII [bacterium]